MAVTAHLVSIQGMDKVTLGAFLAFVAQELLYFLHEVLMSRNSRYTEANLTYATRQILEPLHD